MNRKISQGITSRQEYLLQLLLPLADNLGKAFPRHYFSSVREELIQQFEGLTIYARAPAQGFWEPEDGSRVKDEVIIFEIITPELDMGFWNHYRHKLQRRFRQDTILIRCLTIQIL